MNAILREVEARRDEESKAIEQRYHHLAGLYRPLVADRLGSWVVSWYLEKRREGLPEWLLLSAVATAHASVILEEVGMLRTSVSDPARFLRDNVGRLGREDLWSLSAEVLERFLDLAAAAALARYGAEPRYRGYQPGTLLNVFRAVGLSERDAPHDIVVTEAPREPE